MVSIKPQILEKEVIDSIASSLPFKYYIFYFLIGFQIHQRKVVCQTDNLE